MLLLPPPWLDVPYQRKAVEPTRRSDIVPYIIIIMAKFVAGGAQKLVGSG